MKKLIVAIVLAIALVVSSHSVSWGAKAKSDSLGGTWETLSGLGGTWE